MEKKIKMRKFISLLAVLSLAVSAFTQTAIAADYNEGVEDGEVFLSLTKTAEPLRDLTTNLTVITEEEIKEKSAKNLGEIIEEEVGISYKSYGPLGQAQSVFMRGSTAGQVLVLVDGRPVNDIGTGGGADFTAIPASMIERVEIIRGSGAALYGTGAFGGVINVITKKATPLTPNVNPYFSYGTFNTINAGITGAYANDVVSILIAPSMLSSDGYRQNSFYDSKNIFGKIGVNLTEDSEIVLSGQAYNADLGNPGPKHSPSATAKQFEDNNYLKLDYNTKTEDFKIQVSGYNANYTRKAGDMFDAWGAYFDKYNTVNTGVRGNVTYKDIVTVGLEWDKTEFKQKNLITNVEQINRNRENAAAYVQAILTFGDLTLIPVVRADKNTDYEDVSTPALSAVYKLTDEIKLSGNVSKVWNAPTFGQLFGDNKYYIPAPDLKPEKGVSSDLGVEYNNGIIGVGVTGFYITTDNLIQNVSVPGYKYQAQNVDRTRQYGYEVEVNYNMTKDIKHKLNYTYLRAENTKTHTDLTYKPMHTLNYMLSVSPIKQLKITADVSYVATTYVNTGIYSNDYPYAEIEHCDYLDDYCLVNVRADYQIMEYVSLWVKGNNLTNNDTYQLSYDYPMPGITCTAGIDIKF
jgi:outer membrane cobalamin receptor